MCGSTLVKEKSETMWKDNEREFIGSEFPTPKGGVLRVVSVSTEKSGRYNSKFICKCSICSQDSELFSSGWFTAPKSSLLRGCLPCGCAKAPKWTEDQNIIRIKRKCKTLGYTFHGWKNNKYLGDKTYLDLENRETKNRWDSTSLTHLIQGKGDPLQGRENTRVSKVKTDSYHINSFMKSGSFLEGTVFWRSVRTTCNGAKPYWNYTCPDCSKDEYVKKGLCSGIFESSNSRLKLGQKSCRCPRYRNFLGYFPERSEEPDTLYILHFGDYIKIGRTFDTKRRYRDLARKSEVYKDNITVIKTVKGNHDYIYRTEQWLIEELTERGFYYNKMNGRWSVELFDNDCLQLVEFLLKF